MHSFALLPSVIRPCLAVLSRSRCLAVLMRLWSSALPSLRGALAVVVPIDCAGCGAADVDLCARCRSRFAASAPLIDALADGTPCASGLEYSGSARDAVLAFKDGGRLRLARGLAPPLARALAVMGERAARGGGAATGAADGRGAAAGAVGCGGAAAAGGALPVVALAVPSSGVGRRRRGYEPVDLLLRAAGARGGRPGLEFLRSRGTQRGRSRAERLRSRRLRCSPRWAGRRVVIVDDVRTTGATLTEAARAAREAGADVIGVCALAAVPLRTRS